MSGAGIIFNSVSWFVQLPDRTKTRVKRDDLDTLTEVFTGPSAYEDTFVPAVGAMHPVYSLMTVISSDVRRMPAAVSEITVHYQGKLDNSGATGYTSVPTIGKSWMEGEVSYQVNGSAGYTQAAAPGSGFGPITFTQLGIVTYSRRYTGRCVEVAYITNRIPTGEPTQIGFAKGFLGFQNIWDTMSGFSAGMQLTGGGSPIQQMACTDVRVEDRADGWYRVTEMYQSRMFPGPVGYEFAPPSVSAPALPGNISSDTSGGGDQVTTTTTFGGESSGAAAYGAGQSGGYSLPQSAPGSVGAQTAQQTGIDPQWGNADPGAAAQDQGGSAPVTNASAGGSIWDAVPDMGTFAPEWTT